MKNCLKKLWLILALALSILIWTSVNTYAQGNWDIEWYTIVPEVTWSDIQEGDDAIADIWLEAWEVMDKYREYADKRDDSPNKKIAFGIMDRDVIIDYLKFVVKFLSEAWLAVWVIFIMLAWYKYMIAVFNWLKAPTGTIKNAIIWVIIIIFSYAILKTLTSLVGIS